MTIAGMGLKVKVKVMGLANVVDLTSVEGCLFSRGTGALLSV